MQRLAPAIVVFLAACASRAANSAPTTAPTPALPPIPLVEGPLAVRVQYPSAGALIASRDSNFIFGTTGNGRATLRINGTPVPVHPNGSWLAFLPIPAPEAPQYELVAVAGTDTSRVSHPVRVAPARPQLAATGPLVVDSASVAPRGPLALRAGELVRVAVRAPANAAAWVAYGPGTSATRRRQSLVSTAAPPGPSLAGRGSADSVPQRYRGDAELWATDLRAAWLRDSATLYVARGSDTVRLALPRVEEAEDSLPRWALLGADASAAADTDRVVIGRPSPGGTYKWFLLPGTQVELTGRAGDFARVRLDSALEIWVAAGDVRPLPAGAAAARRDALNATLAPAEGWVDFIVPTGERPPFHVEQRERSLVLTLYGTRATTDIITYGGNDSLVRVVTWEQEATGRARYTLHLSSAPYGYLAFWDRGAFVLRVRRPPRVDARAPLRGLVIAVDPGHPGAPGESPGATGPTGLREAEVTLGIGGRVRALLEQRGAQVVMTRSTPDPVPLGARPVIARRAGAHVLVSIHLNALPDGVNPFTAHGTGTYFFHPQSERLARAVQGGMVARMGLRNLGVYYDNLALTRPTWMPAILCEGAFLMIPEQEAALRTPQFQEAYARGVVEGLERYFAWLAAAR